MNTLATRPQAVDSDLAEAVLSENQLYGDRVSVLWVGKSLALVKTKAHVDTSNRYCHAEVKLVSHGYVNERARQPWMFRIDEFAGYGNTLWTCDRQTSGPRRGRLTAAVKETLVAEAAGYEANVWPGLLAGRKAEHESDLRKREAAEAAKQNETARRNKVSAAAYALMEAAMSEDADRILVEAANYRRTRREEGSCPETS